MSNTLSDAGRFLSSLTDRIGRTESLDALARPAGDQVARVVGTGAVKDALSGTWLGHPLHPLLTDLPIGFWTSAFTLDLLGGRHSRRAATHLVAWGVVTAIPTAVSGASDWSDTDGAARRVGLVHAAANTTALVCYAASWVQRRRGRHWHGVALGLAGATAATVGGFLGGHLLQTLGVGVDRTAFRAPPADWERIASDSEITEQPQCLMAGGAPVIVFRHGSRVVALDAHCPHRGAPMAEGALEGDVLTCPWHGSQFHVPDGALVRGPSVTALPAYDCRVVDGAVEVRAGR